MTFGALCTEKHPAGIGAYSTDRKKEVNALVNALIFLRFIPRAQIKPETVEKETASPPSGDKCCHQPCSVSSRACRPPPGSCFHPLPPVSHPQSLVLKKVGWESRKRCQNAKAVLFFP